MQSKQYLFGGIFPVGNRYTWTCCSGDNPPQYAAVLLNRSYSARIRALDRKGLRALALGDRDDQSVAYGRRRA